MSLDVRWQPMKKLVRDDRGYTRGGFSCSHMKRMDDLERELRYLGAREIVIEGGYYSHQIRMDGWPKGGCSPYHPQVRLCFESNYGSLTFECGKYDKWESNLRAIGLVMQDLRLMKERGVGRGTEQYTGWARLPGGGGGAGIQAAEWARVEDAVAEIIQLADPDGRKAGEVDIRQAISTPALLTTHYRNAAKRCHPDAGGSEAQMSRLNRAKEFIESSRGAS